MYRIPQKKQTKKNKKNTAGQELKGFADRAEFQQWSRPEHKALRPLHQHPLIKGKVSVGERKKAF